LSNKISQVAGEELDRNIEGVVIFFYLWRDAETMSETKGAHIEDYDSALDYLYDLQFFGIKFGLENTRELLRRLGDPHLKYKTIHVTGTNGKGSVCAFLDSIATASLAGGVTQECVFASIYKEMKP